MKDDKKKNNIKSAEVKTETPVTPEKVVAKVAAEEKKTPAKRGRKAAVAVASDVADTVAAGTKKVAAASKKVTAKTVAASPKAKAKKNVVELDKTDAVKKALWEAIGKSKAKKVKDSIAIQVFAEGLDSFFIAIQDGKPKIDRAYYHGNNGELITSEAELLKIAGGKYDIISATASGKFEFNGNLSALIKIMDLF